MLLGDLEASAAANQAASVDSPVATRAHPCLGQKDRLRHL